MKPRRTSPAYVYMAQDKNGSIKVGCSVQPHVRLGQIQELRGKPILLDQFKVRDKAMAYRVEKATHWMLREHFCRRRHFVNEWFSATPDMITACIKQAIRIDRKVARDRDSFLGIQGRMKWWHIIATIHPEKGHLWIKKEMTLAYKSLTS